MLQADEFGKLISGFYASATGDVPWKQTLEEFAQAFDAKSSIVQVRDAAQQTTSVDNFGYTKDFSDTFFAGEVYANDPRIPYFSAVPAGTLYYDDMLYDTEEINSTPWCLAALDVLKTKYQMGAILRLPHQATCAIAVLKTPEQGHASVDAIADLRRFAPHLEQAVAVGHLLECQTASHAAIFDIVAQKSDGIILVNGSGRPTLVNDVAARILSAGDGMAYSGRMFQTQRLPETRRLQLLLADAIAAALDPSPLPSRKPGGQMLVSRPSGHRPYVFRVMPAPATERFLSGHSVACVIHIQDLAVASLPSPASLQQLFGLTTRETQFAIELVRHADLKRAADTAHMALNTGRNHLQSIFRKTGTTGQTELVQLLSRIH